MVDARSKLVYWVENYIQVSWVNFAQNMITDIMEDIRTIVYVRIVEPLFPTPPLSIAGREDALLFDQMVT